MTGRHIRIEIDPQKFADQILDEDEEHLYEESDVLRYIIDEMNDADIDISMIYHDGESIIEYQGQHGFFRLGFASMGNAALIDPEIAMADGMMELSAILNNFDGIKSWVAYRNRIYALHILHIPDVQTAINDSRDMTPTEIREAEDNIEAE